MIENKIKPKPKILAQSLSLPKHVRLSLVPISFPDQPPPSSPATTIAAGNTTTAAAIHLPACHLDSRRNSRRSSLPQQHNAAALDVAFSRPTADHPLLKSLNFSPLISLGQSTRSCLGSAATPSGNSAATAAWLCRIAAPAASRRRVRLPSSGSSPRAAAKQTPTAARRSRRQLVAADTVVCSVPVFRVVLRHQAMHLQLTKKSRYWDGLCFTII